MIYVGIFRLCVRHIWHQFIRKWLKFRMNANHDDGDLIWNRGSFCTLHVQWSKCYFACALVLRLIPNTSVVCAWFCVNAHLIRLRFGHTNSIDGNCARSSQYLSHSRAKFDHWETNKNSQKSKSQTNKWIELCCVWAIYWLSLESHRFSMCVCVVNQLNGYIVICVPDLLTYDTRLLPMNTNRRNDHIQRNSRF